MKGTPRNDDDNKQDLLCHSTLIVHGCNSGRQSINLSINQSIYKRKETMTGLSKNKQNTTLINDKVNYITK